MMTTPLRFLTFLAPNMKPVYLHIVEQVERWLGLPAELSVGRTYDEALLDTTDFTFICGLPYVELMRRAPDALLPIAAPVLEGERFQDRPIYFSDVIVSRGSDFHAFEDLRGAAWAFNEPHSQSGYGIVRQHLLQLGELQGFFGEVIKSGFHEKSIVMVAKKQVDASAIDAQVLQVAFREHPKLQSELRVIAALGPSTIQPLAAAEHVPTDLRQEVQRIVLDLHKQRTSAAILSRGIIKRFDSVDGSSYEDIREMLQRAEQSGFTQIR
jgi:phosphonate transport system substrate-binding protein